MRFFQKKLLWIAPALAMTALAANFAHATEDKYKKYEKKVAAAQKVADQATKKGDSQNIAAAYYQLVKVRAEARRNGVTCDVAYLSDIVGNLQTVVDHSTWFQKNLTGLPVYREFSPDALALHLMAAGLTKGKTFTAAQFAAAVQNAIATSTFELYKPVPGVLPLGSITFSQGTAVDHSVEWTEEGNVKYVDSPKVSASASVIQGKVTISINGRAAYVFKFFRSEKEVSDSIRSTDDVRIEGLDENGNPTSEYMNQLFLTPDECSA